MRKEKISKKNAEQTTTTDATVNTLAGTTESNVESTNTEITTEEQTAVEEEPTPDITTDLVKENPYRYAGYYFDRKTQNYYLHARYYNPRIGRFISLDPLNGKITNPLSLNRYVYGLNNPVNYKDPTGNYNAAVFEVVKEIEGKYKNNPIELAQAYLVQMGYDIGPEGIDGDNSGYAETWRAIKQFQENSGLPATGDIQNIYDPTLGKMKEVVLNWDKYQHIYSYNPDLEFEETNNYYSQVNHIPLIGGIVGEKIGNEAVRMAEEILDKKVTENLLAENAEKYIAKQAAEEAAKKTASKAFFGRSLGLISTLFDFLLLSGDSNQLENEQRAEFSKMIDIGIERITTDPKIKEKLDYDEEGRIIIYRFGNKTLYNLTPTEGKDSPNKEERLADFFKRKDKIGLSWTVIKPMKGPYVQTTIEQVNSTGILIAIPDAGTHVSIIPTADSMLTDYSFLRKWASTKIYLNYDINPDLFDLSKKSLYSKKLMEITDKPY